MIAKILQPYEKVGEGSNILWDTALLHSVKAAKEILDAGAFFEYINMHVTPDERLIIDRLNVHCDGEHYFPGDLAVQEIHHEAARFLRGLSSSNNEEDIQAVAMLIERLAGHWVASLPENARWTMHMRSAVPSAMDSPNDEGFWHTDNCFGDFVNKAGVVECPWHPSFLMALQGPGTLFMNASSVPSTNGVYPDIHEITSAPSGYAAIMWMGHTRGAYHACPEYSELEETRIFFDIRATSNETAEEIQDSYLNPEPSYDPYDQPCACLCGNEAFLP